MDLYTLPTVAVLGGREYGIRWEFRHVLAVLEILDGPGPEWLRWFRAVDAFFNEPVPDGLLPQAVGFLADFITAGQPGGSGPKLFDWHRDANAIISDVNRVAGFEVRREPVHWWTFLAWFRAIGEGQLSALVTVRSKLLRGEKLTDWEQTFYRENRDRVRLSPADDPEKQRLQKLLK